MIDLNLISKGENYQKLKKSFVIFICKFDPFGKGLSKYTFKNLCVEQPDIELQDETAKIFLNPYGNSETISEELREFLKYIGGKDTDSAFTRKLDDEVHRTKSQTEWRFEYMTLLMKEQEILERGIEQGKEVGRTEGRNEGRKEGRKEGCLHTLVKLAELNMISLETAAQQAEMPIEEFKKLCK